MAPDIIVLIVSIFEYWRLTYPVEDADGDELSDAVTGHVLEDAERRDQRCTPFPEVRHGPFTKQQLGYEIYFVNGSKNQK